MPKNKEIGEKYITVVDLLVVLVCAGLSICVLSHVYQENIDRVKNTVRNVLVAQPNFPTPKSEISTSSTNHETELSASTVTEVPTLSPEQINQLLTSINSAIAPFGFQVTGYRLPRPDTQTTGSMQILPIEADILQQKLIEKRQLSVNPIVGEITSPAIPILVVRVSGENGETLWHIIESEVTIKGDQNLSEEQKEILLGTAKFFRRSNLGVEDVLFIAGD